MGYSANPSEDKSLFKASFPPLLTVNLVVSKELEKAGDEDEREKKT